MLLRRREPRAPTRLRGLVKFGASGHEVSCTVVDLSATGAGLSFATTFGIPQKFQLAIDGDRFIRHCHVMWSDGRRLGVCFE
jgi:PilZ domain